MKILFLTTHNLATNPRLVKEINLALSNSFDVEVICFIFRNWSYTLNENLLIEFKKKGVQFHCLEAGKQNLKNWIVSVGIERLNRFLSKITSLKNSSMANAISRRNLSLLEATNKVKNADWVIGHNPGALWATYVAGKRLNAKMGFDVEDYHPGEGHDRHLQKLTKKLIQHLLPKMDYVSFAAPLIMEAIKNDVGSNYRNWITILNYFPKEEFSLPQAEISGRLKLVWFSQNINVGRGLELIIPVVKANQARMELHLYGNINIEFREKELLANNIFIHEPLPQNELHHTLAIYDVGLALEVPEDFNRDLCITNKLLAYLQSGLYILATNTSAQKSLLEKYLKAGVCFDYKKNDSAEVLDSLEKRLDIIRQHHLKRFEEFQDKNWENESMRLISIFNKL